MANWKEIITANREEIEAAMLEAMRTAIECGKIDAVKGQAFQAVNEILLYEDGHVETIRRADGVLDGDVFAGKAISVKKCTDWTSDDFELDEDGDPEDIDVDELLADYYPEDDIDAILREFDLSEEINK